MMFELIVGLEWLAVAVICLYLSERKSSKSELKSQSLTNKTQRRVRKV